MDSPYLIYIEYINRGYKFEGNKVVGVGIVEVQAKN